MIYTSLVPACTDSYLSVCYNVALCWYAFSWMKKHLSLKLGKGCRRHSLFIWQNRVLQYSIASTPNLTRILSVIYDPHSWMPAALSILG